MELFKYIVRFFYRIRWWMVIFPCIAGVIAWFMTRDLEKTYDVKTTIFTGIISGYNVDVTDSRNAGVHRRLSLSSCLPVALYMGMPRRIQATSRQNTINS